MNDPSSEFDLIRWFRARSPKTSPQTLLGIGDDCAILRPNPGRDWVVTTDMLMDGRHFNLATDSPQAVGYKAMAVNLSDIAAMAARPLAALVAVAIPLSARNSVEIGQGLHQGLQEAAHPFGVTLIGGDTNAWHGPLVISVTLLGETTDRGPVLRSGARVGDIIFVTGPLGGSLLGRHLRPEPRVLEALALHAAAPIHALIDISDGLASDLSHILEESGNLGALLDPLAIPIHSDTVTRSGPPGKTRLHHALNDGEDFELCLVVSPNDAVLLENNPPPPARLFRVGEIIASPGLWLQNPKGPPTPLQPAGFDHLKG